MSYVMKSTQLGLIYSHINCPPCSELNMHAAFVIRLLMGLICALRSHMALIKTLQIYPPTDISVFGGTVQSDLRDKNTRNIPIKRNSKYKNPLAILAII